MTAPIQIIPDTRTEQVNHQISSHEQKTNQPAIMRSEAEIKEAIELCQAEKLTDPDCVLTRDATVEALRWALGIDDGDTSPMTCSFAELVKSMKEDRDIEQQIQE